MKKKIKRTCMFELIWIIKQHDANLTKKNQNKMSQFFFIKKKTALKKGKKKAISGELPKPYLI